MSLNLFPVRAPIGNTTDATGRVMKTMMTPEFARALSDLLFRVGGPDGMGMDDVALLASWDSAPADNARDTGADLVAPAGDQVAALRSEIAALREQLALAQPALAMLHEIEQLRIQFSMIEDPAALVRYLQVKAAKPSDLAPLVASVADAGTSKLYSRGDHVHPIPSAGAVTGSRGGNAALASLLTALAAIGLITNSTTP